MDYIVIGVSISFAIIMLWFILSKASKSDRRKIFEKFAKDNQFQFDIDEEQKIDKRKQMGSFFITNRLYPFGKNWDIENIIISEYDELEIKIFDQYCYLGKKGGSKVIPQTMFLANSHMIYFTDFKIYHKKHPFNSKVEEIFKIKKVDKFNELKYKGSSSKNYRFFGVDFQKMEWLLGGDLNQFLDKYQGINIEFYGQYFLVYWSKDIMNYEKIDKSLDIVMELYDILLKSDPEAD